MLFIKFNPNNYREDFTVLSKNIRGQAPIYFDNACMTLRPKQVVDKITEYYNEYPGCHGRSGHKFGAKVTIEFDKARRSVQKFLGAKHKDEIIFTKNATEAINLVAHGMDLQDGDVVINSDREHSSNIVPWLELHKDRGVERIYIPSKKDETFDLVAYETELHKNKGKVKLVSIVYTSNLDGYTLPVKDIIKRAHRYKIPVLLDAAQAAPHQEINVQELDVDFLAISSHKMCGPTGVGALYGKRSQLEKLKPFITGGSTVVNTTYTNYELAELPARFEAGLQNYSGVAGFGVACEYLQNVKLDKISKHENVLTRYFQEKLTAIPKVKIVGVQDPRLRGGITSFVIEGMNYHDTALLLDEAANIMCRSGQHCLHSWFNSRKILGSVRASFYFYNTKQEIDIMIEALKKIASMSK
ncbi:cysteine desulfurase [Candidatus Woesearchaeota archaeon]|jgi:cysteine desulfurase / selenocysteine lyase|nr:cysteine desulfurase [Candidatus Woesearchaeota archaeon]MBT4114594.1 cysteine desulfurase [Candidatus Woesearchaeota archaeon]MBT4248475.1 cysteine desulfurase [Candidatus Woesearchaeota archaeon]